MTGAAETPPVGPAAPHLPSARVADALTGARAALAVAVALLLAGSRLDAAAVALCAAWATDALDGRLARAAEGGTALGE